MKTVTMRQFTRSAQFARLAAGGTPILVTRNGQPWFQAGPARGTKKSFVGAAPQTVLPRDVWQSDGEDWEDA